MNKKEKEIMDEMIIHIDNLQTLVNKLSQLVVKR